MKSAFDTISKFAAQAQRYLPVAMLIFAMGIRIYSPESGGGTGL